MSSSINVAWDSTGTQAKMLQLDANGNLRVSSEGGMAQTTTLLNAVIATGAGSTVQVTGGNNRTFTATEAGTGAITATVVVEVTNTPAVTTSWITLGTISLTGTNTAQAGFADPGAYAYVRGNVTAITGTGAAVTLTLGV